MRNVLQLPEPGGMSSTHALPLMAAAKVVTAQLHSPGLFCILGAASQQRESSRNMVRAHKRSRIRFIPVEGFVG